MMDPDSWKYEALNHRWFKDDNAYADYSEGEYFGLPAKLIAVHFNGARGSSAATTQTGGPVSFNPTEAPFEVKPVKAFELKDTDGSVKYKVTRIVYENNTLTFTLNNVSSNEEVTAAMGIAPEGFTTDLFDKNAAQTRAPAEPVKPQTSSFTPHAPWICPCGTENIGNFCKDCGHPRG